MKHTVLLLAVYFLKQFFDEINNNIYLFKREKLNANILTIPWARQLQGKILADIQDVRKNRQLILRSVESTHPPD